MARRPILSLLLLVCITRMEAFSFHETVNEMDKPFIDSDYSIGPEFAAEGKFAYVKVKELSKTPPAIRVDLLIYDKRSSKVSQSFKKFGADRVSTSISVTSMKLKNSGPVFLTISEKQKSGEDKITLIKWEPFGCPDPNLHLTLNHTIVNRGGNFEVFINDNETCHTSNGMCRIEFRDEASPVREEFLNGDLIWSSMHVDYASYGDEFFISGFDTNGNYRFLTYFPSEERTLELFSLANANRALKAHSIDNGFCFVQEPDESKSVSCLRFNFRHGGEVIFNRTVTYDEPVSLLQVKETDLGEILLVTKSNYCDGMDCFDIIVKKVPRDSPKPITHHDLTLECSDADDKMLNVDVTKGNRYVNTLVIEYVCENKHRFILKSITVDSSYWNL